MLSPLQQLYARRVRYLFVVNPVAGGGRAARRWPEVSERLSARGLEHDVVFTQPNQSDLLERIGSLPPDTAVVAVGGDGTTRSLLPALVGSNRLLGVVPLGRGNDLAATLGWQVGSLDDALARLSRPAAPLDVLRVCVFGKNTYSLNGLGTGFDAQVTETAARLPERLGGFGGYALGALLSVGALRNRGLELRVDGQLVFQGEGFLAAVMNGTRYGGGFYISPQGRPDDGLLNVLAGRSVSRLELLPLMARVLKGRHLGHPKVVHVTGRHVTLRWAEPTPLHIDGDLEGRVDALEVTLLPGAIQLLGAPAEL